MDAESQDAAVGQQRGAEATPRTSPIVPREPIAGHRHRPHRRPLIRRLANLIRESLISLKRWYFRKIWKMDLHPRCKFSLTAHFDTTNPRGVHVGEGSYVAFGAVILAHDMSRLIHANTIIGKNCFIGAHSIIMPGVTVGDECIVGSGAVVTRDVPAHSVCVGNPAQIVKTGIRTATWGILLDAREAALADAAAEQAR
jgi:acetyltransferase-like isoleucine patch superfamily enzyme